MLPRKCKKCKCYVAPQLDCCPRCNHRVPAIVVPTKPTKEDKQAEREARDAKLPRIRAFKMSWRPSALAVRSHKGLLDEVRRKIDKADTAQLRNALRSELRLIKSVLAKAEAADIRKTWTTEIFHAKHACVTVFVSPKQHRYVLATRDGPADLIIVPRKKDKALPHPRLVRFERSPFARQAKQAKKEEVVHAKRKKAKKERRLKKRQKPTLL